MNDTANTTDPKFADTAPDTAPNATPFDDTDVRLGLASLSGEADATEPFVVANNGVRDRDSVFEYLDYGADAVSVWRPSDSPAVLGRVRTAIDDWFESEGNR